MTKVLVTRDKLDELALQVSDKSGEDMPLTVDEMIDAVAGISRPTDAGVVTQDQDGYLVLSDQGGGGGGGSTANVVYGTFEYGAEYAGTAQTINLAYSGTGYPIAVVVNTTDDDFASLVLQYAIQSLSIVKREWATAPTYSGTTTENLSMQARRYKASSSDSQSYSSSSTDPYTAYSTSAATSGNTFSLRVTSDTTISVFIRGESAYGFAPAIEYMYYVIYSS